MNGYNSSGVSDAATKKVVLKSQYTYKDINQAQTTNQIAGISLTNNSGYSKNLSYLYDANGNITNANGITYVYDEANQLTRVNDPVYGTTTYQYDKGGNLVSEKNYAYTMGALQSVVNQKSYYVLSDRLQTVTVNGVTKGNSYDINGNPINYYNGMVFNCEMGRQLSGITNGSNNISYKYNEKGIRTSKTVNGVTTKYTLVDDRITYQTDGTTSMYYRYDSSNSLIGFEYTKGGVTTDYYYVKNLQGDIIGILDKEGNSVVEYSYDAWGKLQSVTGSLASTVGQDNAFRYRGYYYDVETGFFYVGSRYYDPTTCRFINADDTAMLGLSTNNPVSSNLFSYCNNNPVMHSDPKGMYAAAISLSTPAFYAFVDWLSAIAAADWRNPVGWVLAIVLSAGVITWAAVSYYKKYQIKVIDKIEQKVPSNLKHKDGRIDLSKFNNPNGPKFPKGGRGKLGPMGWYILKDLDNHKGSIWKMFNWAGERIASLASDGKIVGK